MKKQYVNSVSILLTMLCLAFTACNGMFTGGDTGTVRVVIGGGTARSVGGKGLPALNEKNTVITITDEEGTALARETTSVTVTLPIGTKITVKAVVTTAAGEWHGSEKHTVTAGDNFIAVKLSKTLKVAANLLVSITGEHNSGSNIVSLSTQNGKKLLDGILIGKKPVTARDRIGRLYVLYDDISSPRHLKRFDVEGNEDTSFPSSGLSGAVASTTDIAVDIKTDTLFFVNRMSAGWTLYFTNKENAFNLKGPFPIPIPSGYTADTIQAIAAYNGMVYIALATNASPQLRLLLAYQAALSGSTLTLTHKATQELSNLRTDSAFDNTHTNCTGLFADESGVYCLLAENATQWASESYGVGKLIRYDYSGGTLTKKTEQGLNPAASGSDRPIPFDDQYFFYPTGFIGSDEDNIYIADDGFGIQYKNENWHIMNNQNRIAAFNRKTDSLSFSEAGVTWYEQKPEYKLPNTKILLWGKSYGSIKYWTSADGTGAFSPSNKLFESASGKDPTDIFCYDQDGNLYILWKESFGYNVRRFALKEDGSYDTQGVDLNNSFGSHPISAIAVDISDGQNYLYYTYEDGPNKHIQRYRWNGSSFSTATQDSMYGVHISSTSNKIFFTALAANKDGVFVGVKEKYQEGGVNKYRLKVQKYARTDHPAHPDGELTLVDNAPSYADPSNPDTPISNPNPSSNAQPPYIEYEEAINDLQVVEGTLYAITSKAKKLMKFNSSEAKCTCDEFKMSSTLYKIDKTAGAFSGIADKLAEKNPVSPEGTNPGAGYGFYRFIAVKPKKLVIASDGAWGKDGNSTHTEANNNEVFEYDLGGNLNTPKDAAGKFSKELQVDSGFKWE